MLVMKKEGIILAAGKGTRMPKSEIPKVLYQLKGRPMIEYLVGSFKEAGIERPILVVGYKQETVKDLFGDRVEYVIQKRQLGTGHAVMAARDRFKGRQTDSLLIAYGDMPLWSPETIERIFAKKKQTGATLVLATVNLPENFAYGRIIRDQKGRLQAIVEEKDCSRGELKIKEKNPGLYLVDINWLFRALRKIRPNNTQGEYYLTDIVGLAVKEGRPVETIEIKNKREAMGVNTKEDYQAIQRVI